MNAYIKLGITALLPVILSVIFYLLDRKSRFRQIDDRSKQIIWGISFGLLAIVGNEWSIAIDGALVNCRDAAVISAGLFFGGPAGIIAGVIGGVERWIAVAWGAGYYTRLACSVSTILAGIFSAALRKHMFQNQKPSWPLSAGVGLVFEVFHLTMVFLTNLDTPNRCMDIIRACTGPMIIGNTLSVMFSSLILYILMLRQGELKKENNQPLPISKSIQRWLLGAIITAFVATTSFLWVLQTQTAYLQGNKLLTMALDETIADIQDTSDAHLLLIAKRLKENIKTDEDYDNLAAVAKSHGIAEINIINSEGIIVKSTNESFIGYDMASGSQSSEFLCLLKDQETFVQPYGTISINSHISRKYAGIKYKDGFIQVGYDANQFQVNIAQDIINITKNRHVGQTGRVLITDQNNTIVSAPGDMSLLSVQEIVSNEYLPIEDMTLHLEVNDCRYWIRHSSVEGYTIISVLPEDEVMQMKDMSLYINSFLEVLIFALLFGLIYILINHFVVNKVQRINTSLTKIASGDLDEVVDERSNKEFSSLSDDINSTVNTLKQYIDEASKRLDQELELAKNIQISALPSVFPAFPKRKDLDIFASMDAAKLVGGDFYDFYMTNNDILNFLVADVSGKGIPAAMFMMRAKTELKSLTEADLSLADIFTRGNNNLCQGNDAGMFVTVWQGAINLTTGLVQYANAGHNPPVVRHGDGNFEFLKTRPGFILAGMDGIQYKTQELQLSPGDIIYLYTDGVTEAMNSSKELYGNDRLLNALNHASFENMQELCQCVKFDVDAFVGDAPQFDDITMVAFQYIGLPPVPSIHFEEANIDDIQKVTEFVEKELKTMGCPRKSIIQIKVAIDEIFSNILHYGYPNKKGPVTVDVIEREDPHSVYIRFSDHGIPYNPIKAEDPDVTLSAEEREIGGLGIYLVKQSMDDMKYKYENGQNILTIQKII